MITENKVIELGGLAIKVDDVLGFKVEAGLRMVELKNGMKIKITRDERDLLMKLMSSRVGKASLFAR